MTALKAGETQHWSDPTQLPGTCCLLLTTHCYRPVVPRQASPCHSRDEGTCQCHERRKGAAFKARMNRCCRRGSSWQPRGVSS